ncbi:MAG TPA: response regulator transcription factor [Candidatus Brocadiales bacterium]|nr:response regulator transcription factor [Candidatus Brocadiales bacterium]
MPSNTILVIDDEKDLIELVRYNLENDGFQVVSAADGYKGLRLAKETRPDLVLLDLMLPGINGLEVCRSLKKNDETSGIPVIMLTAKGTEADIVAGLEMGADDYITKPFSPKVLVARVKTALRRKESRGRVTPPLQADKLTLDSEKHEVYIEDEPITLTLTEFKLLRYLMERRGRVLTRDQILNAVLGDETIVVDRVVDVHITSLRKKLGDYGSYILTVRGIGYKFKE